MQVEGAECEGTEFPAGQPLPAFKNLMISSLKEKVKITFLQNLNLGGCLKGEVIIKLINVTKFPFNFTIKQIQSNKSILLSDN